MIVTTTAIVCFITNAAGSNAFYVSTSAVSLCSTHSVQETPTITDIGQAIPICGIAFNLIVIRADKYSAKDYYLHSRASTPQALSAPQSVRIHRNSGNPRRSIMISGSDFDYESQTVPDSRPFEVLIMTDKSHHFDEAEASASDSASNLALSSKTQGEGTSFTL